MMYAKHQRLGPMVPLRALLFPSREMLARKAEIVRQSVLFPLKRGAKLPRLLLYHIFDRLSCVRTISQPAVGVSYLRRGQ
jgi:hypothetical protein